ncbi:hypothetical protein ACFSQ7_43880 [Paenibacillus rhizoplanae]
MKYADGAINYVYLDMTANGKEDSILKKILERLYFKLRTAARSASLQAASL